MTPATPSLSPLPSRPILLDAQGGGHPLDGPDSDAVPWEDALLWWPLDAKSATAIEPSEGMRFSARLSEILAAVPSPSRPLACAGGLLLGLRGVEWHPGNDEPVLTSLRLWVAPKRILTLATSPLSILDELRADLAAGVGPIGVSDFIGRLALGLIRDLGPLLDRDNDNLDLLETRLLTGQINQAGSDLGKLRLRALRLHRYLSPQRTLLHELLQARGRHQLDNDHETNSLVDASTRVEDRLERLEGLGDHSVGIQQSLNDLQSQRMNTALYLLSLYTALFLPMGVLTGLLGINVGGIPGANTPWAFWLVCFLLVLLGLLGLYVFYRKGLFQPVKSGDAPASPSGSDGN